MVLEKVSLTDGIVLSAFRTDKFKTGLINFTFSIPFSAKNAAYNTLLPELLKRGTEKFPDISSIDKRLDELYSTTLDMRSSRIGKNLILSVTADLLDEKYIFDDTNLLDEVLELVFEILTKPRLIDGLFPDKIFEQEKRFFLENIDASKNNTRNYSLIRLSEMMYSRDMQIPTIEESKKIVSEITNRDIVDFYKTVFLSAPVEIFYIGSLDINTVKDKTNCFFAGRDTVRPLSTKTIPYAEPVCDFKSVCEKMPVSQGKLAIGFKTDTVISTTETDYYSVILMNEIFGGSAASKLFLNVREKLNLCYFCSSSYNQYTGVLTVSSGIENKNRDIAEKAILSEFEKVKRGEISDIEIESAKKSLKNAYRQLYDSPYDILSFYGNRGYFSINDTIESTEAAILSLTREDVVRVANKVVLDSMFFVEGTSTYDEEDEENE